MRRALLAVAVAAVALTAAVIAGVFTLAELAERLDEERWS